MGASKAVVDDAMFLSFDAQTFTLSEYLVRSVAPSKIKQGTFLYKKPNLTLDFTDGIAWKGIVSDKYIDFGINGQFERVEDK